MSPALRKAVAYLGPDAPRNDGAMLCLRRVRECYARADYAQRQERRRLLRDAALAMQALRAANRARGVA